MDASKRPEEIPHSGPDPLHRIAVHFSYPIPIVVPCHRVLGRSGALTGYHWGLTRKRAILGWEAGVAAGTA